MEDYIKLLNGVLDLIYDGQQKRPTLNELILERYFKTLKED